MTGIQIAFDPKHNKINFTGKKYLYEILSQQEQFCSLVGPTMILLVVHCFSIQLFFTATLDQKMQILKTRRNIIQRLFIPVKPGARELSKHRKERLLANQTFRGSRFAINTSGNYLSYLERNQKIYLKRYIFSKESGF